MKIVILAGGSGTRLWPISRTSFPKQFLHFGDGLSLMQKTICRFLERFSQEDIWIVTHQEYFHLVKSQASQLRAGLEQQILIEPERKNTGPAIAFAIQELQKRGIEDEECVLIASSDHVIAPETTFLDALIPAEKMAKQGYLIIFGIRPHKPEIGYGYIKAVSTNHDRVQKVAAFIEKPNLQKAQEFLLSGEYLWNAGIFLFQVGSFLREMQQHAPVLVENSFKQMPVVSIDKALLEKSNKVMVVPLDISWSDVGSWDSLYEVLDKDSNHNVQVGNVFTMNTKNCFIMSDKRLVATIGLEDLILVDTQDALFIGKRGESQLVKALVESLVEKNSKVTEEHVTTHRPWGAYTILEESERYKIKRIVVHPQERLSLQMHYHRSEHWVVVKGTAKVTVGEKEMLVHENESIYVPKSTNHRLENPGKVNLEIIEVQVGEYVGEDDIIRFQDIYGRACGVQS